MDSETLALLGALVNDDAKAKRLEELRVQMVALNDLHKALDEQRDKNQAILHEAQKAKAAAEEIKGHFGAVSAALDARESEIGKVSDSLNAQKADFEKVRATVDAQHQARADELAAREAAVAAKEPDIAAREDAVAVREKAAGERQKSLDTKHERLALAMADNAAE